MISRALYSSICISYVSNQAKESDLVKVFLFLLVWVETKEDRRTIIKPYVHDNMQHYLLQEILEGKSEAPTATEMTSPISRRFEPHATGIKKVVVILKFDKIVF